MNSDYLQKWEKIKELSKEENTESEICLRLLAILKDEKYVKMSTNKYCPKCSFYYDEFLYRNYGINTDMIRVFYMNPYPEQIYYQGEIISRDSRYIPVSIIEKCRQHYAEHQKKINYSLDKNELLEIYKQQLQDYKERIERIPEEFFTTKPTSTSSKIHDLATIFVNNCKHNGCFLDWILEPQNIPLLYVFYNVYQAINYNNKIGNKKKYKYELVEKLEKKHKELRPLPQDFYKDIENKYYCFTIHDLQFRLDHPQIVTRKVKKCKGIRTSDEFTILLQEKKDIMNTREFAVSYLNKQISVYQFLGELNILRNENLPLLQFEMPETLTDLKKLAITYERFKKETIYPFEKQIYQEYLDKLEFIRKNMIENKMAKDIEYNYEYTPYPRKGKFYEKPQSGSVV